MEIDLPDDFACLGRPTGVANRLQHLLDRQDAGDHLAADERQEAEGIVNVAEFLTLLRLK